MRSGSSARAGALVLAGAMLGAGCGSAAPPPVSGSASIPPALQRESRPLGRGIRFHPPARGPVIGTCRPRLGAREGVHIEIFAANRVVLLAGGIGVRAPVRRFEGRIAGAACYGALVTLEPTGVVLVRPGAELTLAAVFRAWGQPLTDRRVASFAAGHGRSVRVFVGGRRRFGSPASVALRRHAEIVLEVGPLVAPHRRYTFPPGV